MPFAELVEIDATPRAGMGRLDRNTLEKQKLGSTPRSERFLEASPSLK
jgi:hypothetical protein